MDSVEFSFSFSPSRTPSRRRSAALVLAFVALFLASAPARAQTQGPMPAPASKPAPAAPAPVTPAPAAKPARADSLPHRSRPFFVMLRSAAVPGWGQAYNQKYLKAGMVVAGEGFLGYGAWKELQRENDAVDRLSAVSQAAFAPGDPEYNAAQLDVETHRNRKINWIWWGLAAHLVNMVDAYVDAHLASFEAEFGPPESALDLGEGPRLTLAVRTRF